MLNPIQSFAVMFFKWLPAVTVTVSLFLASLTEAEQKIDFATDIRPILSDSCYHCHGPDAAARKADLRLDEPVHVYDLQATILGQKGIDHERLTYRYQGRYFRLTDVHGKIVKDILT